MPFTSNSFNTFYREYLREHRHPANRFLHHTGTLLALLFGLIAIYTRYIGFLGIGILVGYGLAWVGHYFVEKNRPTTFSRPIYSFIADFVMLYDLFTFRLEKKIRDIE